MIPATSSYPRVQPVLPMGQYEGTSEALRKNPWGWYPGFGFYRHHAPDVQAHPKLRYSGSSPYAAGPKTMDPWLAYGLGFGLGMSEPGINHSSGEHPLGEYVCSIVLSKFLTLDDFAYLGYLTKLTANLSNIEATLGTKHRLVNSVSHLALRHARGSSERAEALRSCVAGHIVEPAKTDRRADPEGYILDCLVEDYSGPGADNPKYTCGVKRIAAIMRGRPDSERQQIHQEIVAVYEDIALGFLTFD